MLHRERGRERPWANPVNIYLVAYGACISDSARTKEQEELDFREECYAPSSKWIAGRSD